MTNLQFEILLKRRHEYEIKLEYLMEELEDENEDEITMGCQYAKPADIKKTRGRRNTKWKRN